MQSLQHRSHDDLRPQETASAVSVVAGTRAAEDAVGGLQKKAKCLPDVQGQHPLQDREYSAGQVVQKPPIRTYPSFGGTPPHLEDLNIHDGSATPIHTSIGFQAPAPDSRKRTFAEENLDQSRRRPPSQTHPFSGSASPNAQSNPDMEDPNTHVKKRISSTVSLRSSYQAPGPIRTQPLRAYNMLPQLETRPISEEQLVNEVKGIYAGLVMVEKKCVEIDQQQASKKTELSDEQWQALIALHRTLLHEHHDFFLASQHPSASPALQKLASRYAMPARMWRHGIHSFLELLRHRLPDTLEYMLAFICTAYSMMTLLVESVPSFEETWIECLGDLARYRMAIEEVDRYDREVWAGVAQYWYSKAANKSPNVGRIQHHLAILARTNILQQLFYYVKSLVCIQPFPNTQDSIQLLFKPIMDSRQERSSPVMTSFVKCHGTLFAPGPLGPLVQTGNDFMTLLASHISRVGTKFGEQGAYIASVNFGAMLGYGKEGAVLMEYFSKQDSSPVDTDTTSRINSAKEYWASAPFPRTPLSKSDLSKATDHFKSFSYATYLAFHVLSFILRHIGSKNIMPHVHVSLVFLWNLAVTPQAMEQVEMEVPWQKLVTFLNGPQLVADGAAPEDRKFPACAADGTPWASHLPEDRLVRGQIWSSCYYPDGFFEQRSPSADEDERFLELPDMGVTRAERCRWLGHRLASMNRWIQFDGKENKFQVTKFALDLENLCEHGNIFAPVTKKRRDNSGARYRVGSENNTSPV